MFTPFLFLLHRFHPFVANISLNFTISHFFWSFGRSLFFHFFTSVIRFRFFLLILGVFPRFRPFFVLMSFVRGTCSEKLATLDYSYEL